LESDELDMILQVVENPVRRKIIKRLSQEPAYQLQLSKELGLGQSLVAKHLKIMKDAGMVAVTGEESARGPDRKRYSLARRVTITMDLGPNLFIEKGTAFGARPGKDRSEFAARLRRRVEVASVKPDDAKRVSMLSGILGDIDRRIQEVEDERTELLDVRNQAMGEAARVVSKLEGIDVRKVLLHVLDEHDSEVQRISEALNIREFSVKSILDELEDYLE
jgi:predicted transcriptional regulator